MGMNKAAYSYLLNTYGRQPKYWMGIAALIVQTLCMRIVAVIIVARLAVHVTGSDLDAARIDVFLYMCTMILGLSMRLIKELLATKAENEEYGKLTVGFYKKLVNKDMSFFRDHQTGYLAGIFRQHADSIMDFARLVRGELIQTPITLVIPVVVLFIASWQVGLAVLGIVIIQMIYIFWASSVAHDWRKRSHEIYRKISGTVSDDVTNIVAYKTSGLAKAAERHMEQLTDQEVETFTKRWRLMAMLDGPRELITAMGTAAAFWIIVSTSDGAGSVGLVLLTITYMMQIYGTIVGLPELITRHDDLITKLYPTLEYITDKYEDIKDPVKPRKFAVSTGAIDIDDLHFAYHDGKGKSIEVFKGLDLHIKGGEQIGVVGLSGAGKSTLASLLLRFDEIEGGSIKVDGIDIRDVRQEDLRKKIAYVPQEPLLFHRTIRENLQYVGTSATDAKIVRAAKAAHAHEFITKLPYAYDTMVGERGVKLSGGQKQRVVIARAILKDAPIMLFDEATSALDSESERIIQKALPGIIGKRTALVIAHRLSTVAGLDRIIVMHDGKIIEQGTHKELLKQEGRYYSLWQKQTSNDHEK
jgi:ATP-binding cassette, subfamily B, bacterial